MSTVSSLFLLFLLVLGTAAPPAAGNPDSIYNTLQYYGFPPGLVPKDVVTRYDLNPNTGQFTVFLNTTCAFTAYHYEVKFGTQVTGVITRDEIENIHGVQVRVMNDYWFNIQTVEMAEDNEEVEFSAGYMAADFPVNYFYNLPECGCGFDCPGPGPGPGPAPGPVPPAASATGGSN